MYRHSKVKIAHRWEGGREKTGKKASLRLNNKRQSHSSHTNTVRREVSVKSRSRSRSYGTETTIVRRRFTARSDQKKTESCRRETWTCHWRLHHARQIVVRSINFLSHQTSLSNHARRRPRLLRIARGASSPHSSHLPNLLRPPHYTCRALAASRSPAAHTIRDQAFPRKNTRCLWAVRRTKP